MKPQAALFDDDVGPDPRHQVFFADDFIRRGAQNDKNVERAPTQFDGRAPFRQEPFVRDQIERTKRQSVFDLTRNSHHGVLVRSRLCQGRHCRSKGEPTHQEGVVVKTL